MPSGSFANAASVVRGGPNPENAQRFVEFVASARVERMLAESDSHNVPVRSGLSGEFPEYRIERPLSLPSEAVVRAIPIAMRLCERLL